MIINILLNQILLSFGHYLIHFLKVFFSIFNQYIKSFRFITQSSQLVFLFTDSISVNTTVCNREQRNAHNGEVKLPYNQKKKIKNNLKVKSCLIGINRRSHKSARNVRQFQTEMWNIRQVVHLFENKSSKLYDYLHS